MIKTFQENDEIRLIHIPEEMEGKRLDVVLAKLVPDYSRTRLQTFIEQGRVSENENIIRDCKYKVSSGGAFSLSLPEARNPFPQPEALPLTVVYEDQDLLVVNKPVGLVVHPAAGNNSGTLVNALLHHCGEVLSSIGDPMRPGIVHRLDKDTSGLLVVAKTQQAYHHLCAQFADHGRSGSLRRMYHAFIWGALEFPKGTIEAALARSSINREKIVVSKGEQAKYAVTHYELEETYLDGEQKPVISLVHCYLETGRTHQIRVHMAYQGHPVVGDTLYGSGFKTKMNRLKPNQKKVVEQLSHQALHATQLGFEHPRTKEDMLFESSLPEDLENLKEILRT